MGGILRLICCTGFNSLANEQHRWSCQLQRLTVNMIPLLTESQRQCPLCRDEYGVMLQRTKPRVFPCGHTCCFGCASQAEICRQCESSTDLNPTHAPNVAFQNLLAYAHDAEKFIEKAFALNDASVNDELSIKQEDVFNSLHFCFDCSVTFDPHHFTIMGETHIDHVATTLRDKDKELIRSGLWLSRIVKSGKPDLSKFECLLQVQLQIALEYQQNLQNVMRHLKENPNIINAFRNDCKNYIVKGLENDKITNRELLSSLLQLRKADISFAVDILAMAKITCPISIGSIIDDKVIEDLRKDSKSQLPIGLTSNLISRLPKLTHHITMIPQVNDKQLSPQKDLQTIHQQLIVTRRDPIEIDNSPYRQENCKKSKGNHRYPHSPAPPQTPSRQTSRLSDLTEATIQQLQNRFTGTSHPVPDLLANMGKTSKSKYNREIPDVLDRVGDIYQTTHLPSKSTSSGKVSGVGSQESSLGKRQTDEKHNSKPTSK